MPKPYVPDWYQTNSRRKTTGSRLTRQNDLLGIKKAAAPLTGSGNGNRSSAPFPKLRKKDRAPPNTGKKIYSFSKVCPLTNRDVVGNQAFVWKNSDGRPLAWALLL